MTARNVDSVMRIMLIQKYIPGASPRTPRRHSIIIIKEPSGLFGTDGKRPDGLALVPWQSGRSLCWDVTVTCPLAESYVTGSAREAGAAAELAASRKGEKYANIGSLRSSRG